MVYLPHWPIPSTLGKKIIDYETVFERAKIVLERLGNPHLHLPPVIHIAGTNGKGSTASLIAKIFECQGYTTHLYTSPHLIDCNERIKTNGQKISDNQLFTAMEAVRIASSQGAKPIDLTFMEGFTIGAFEYFAQHPADVAIIECGMGARIDITNIIDQKLASILTSISMDHAEYLGDSLEKIAIEKAHVMRRNTPLIVAPQVLKISNLLKILADDQGAVSYFYPTDYAIIKNLEDGSFDFLWNDEVILPNLSAPKLQGNHQYHNFSCAIACCMAISDKFTFNYKGINQAINNVEWPSRLEKIANKLNKLFKNSASEIWIDGAHNEDGARALANWLEEQNNLTPMRNFVICGFSRQKCKINFLQKFHNLAEIYAVRVAMEPYPEESEIIVKTGNSANLNIVNGINLLTSLENISAKIGDQSCRIVICGSLHLARDVDYFNRTCGEQQ